MRRLFFLSVLLSFVISFTTGCRVTWNGSEWEISEASISGRGPVATLLAAGDDLQVTTNTPGVQVSVQEADFASYSLALKTGETIRCKSIALPFSTNGGGKIKAFPGADFPEGWEISQRQDPYWGTILQLSGSTTQTLSGELLEVIDRGSPILEVSKGWFDGWTRETAKQFINPLAQTDRTVYEAVVSIDTVETVIPDVRWSIKAGRLLEALPTASSLWIAANPEPPAIVAGQVRVFQPRARYIGPAPATAPSRYQLLSQERVEEGFFLKISSGGKMYSGWAPANPPEKKQKATTWGEIKK